MVFEDPQWVGSKCEFYEQYHNAIGYYNMVATTGDVVRKWVAPHAGTVRIEGNVEFSNNILWVGNVRPVISVSGEEIWSPGERKIKQRKSHDITMKIDKGDAICFSLIDSCRKNIGNVIWDPVITYVDNTGK